MLTHQSRRVLYVDSEHKFSSTRLLEIVRAHDASGRSTALENEALDSVLVLQPGSMRELTSHLEGLEKTGPALCLMVLDSVAQLVRPMQHDAGVKGLTARQTELAQLAACLKRLATHGAFPVLVTNQVSTDAGGGLGAALGTLWSHAINTRLQLHQTSDGVRYVQLTKSVSSPSTVVAYRITAGGATAHPGAPPPPADLLQPGSGVLDQRIIHAGRYTDRVVE